MDYRAWQRRNLLIIVSIFVAVLAACSLLAGFMNMLRVLTFGVVALVCMITGPLFILRRWGDKERFALVLLAAWFGLTFGLLMLVGMLIDPKSSAFSWAYKLEVAGITTALTFVVVLLGTLIYRPIMRAMRRQFGIPFTSRHKWWL